MRNSAHEENDDRNDDDGYDYDYDDKQRWTEKNIFKKKKSLYFSFFHLPVYCTQSFKEQRTENLFIGCQLNRF